MMSPAGFAAAGRHRYNAGDITISVQNGTQGQRPGMTSLIGAQCQAEDQRHGQSLRGLDQIGKTCDNIVLLVNRSFGVCQKIVPEIRFGGFQLDHQNSGFRRGAGKFRLGVRGSGCDSRQRCTVAGVIPGGNQGKRIAGGERLIQLIPGIFRSIWKRQGKRVRWNALIPDPQDS